MLVFVIFQLFNCFVYFVHLFSLSSSLSVPSRNQLGSTHRLVIRVVKSSSRYSSSFSPLSLLEFFSLMVPFSYQFDLAQSLVADFPLLTLLIAFLLLLPHSLLSVFSYGISASLFLYQMDDSVSRGQFQVGERA